MLNSLSLLEKHRENLRSNIESLDAVYESLVEEITSDILNQKSEIAENQLLMSEIFSKLTFEFLTEYVKDKLPNQFNSKYNIEIVGVTTNTSTFFIGFHLYHKNTRITKGPLTISAHVSELAFVLDPPQII